MFKLRDIRRSQKSLKLNITGPSGSGKTYSAILLAQGLEEDDSKIAVIDSENSIDLYETLCRDPLKRIQVGALEDYSPESYIKAIDICEKAGANVIILDSISHCWEILLSDNERMGPNTYFNWRQTGLRQKTFMQFIMASPCHLITTTRAKQDYLVSEYEGKWNIQKVGLKPVQRADIDYEFDICFDLGMDHQVTVSKNRTMLFENGTPFIVTRETGKQLIQWCQEGDTLKEIYKEAITAFSNCTSGRQWNELKEQYESIYQVIFPAIVDVYKRLSEKIAARKAAKSQPAEAVGHPPVPQPEAQAEGRNDAPAATPPPRKMTTSKS
jgi:hypothetical protein